MKPSITMTKVKNALKELESAKAELYSIRQSTDVTIEEFYELIHIRDNLKNIVSSLEMLLKGGKV